MTWGDIVNLEPAKPLPIKEYDWTPKNPGRIKVGAQIMQDYSFGRWPVCNPPKAEYQNEVYEYKAKNADMIFDIRKTHTGYECVRPGYGLLGGDYGNGSVFVYGNGSVFVSGEGVEML